MKPLQEVILLDYTVRLTATTKQALSAKCAQRQQQQLHIL